MDLFTLNPADLQVESFDIYAPAASGDTTVTVAPPGMKTYEPGCTTPELCPNTTNG